jgi:ferredoxin
MSARVDSGVTTELAYYGGDTVAKCFNCGNCTAACSLTNQDAVFPRRYIRYIQMGLKAKMLESVDPWLCYYCGDCSDTCPREAEPGKLMMAGRRWLISMYDWTGLSRLMYKRPAWEIGLLAAVAAVVLGLFTLPENFGFRLLARHPEALQTVALGSFAPKEIVHWGDIVMALILAVLLLSNAARMTYFVMRRSPAVPLSAYLGELKELALHGLTQKRWRDCRTDSTKHWLRHLSLLVSGRGRLLPLDQFAGLLCHAHPAGRDPLDRPRPA